MKSLLVAALAAAPLFAGNAELADAIQAGRRAAAIEMIAKKSADVNAAGADGTTPLLWAANMNDTELVSRLLKAGANPNQGNLLASTPLAEAALHANTVMMQMLVGAGADVNAAGADGQAGSLHKSFREVARIHCLTAFGAFHIQGMPEQNQLDFVLAGDGFQSGDVFADSGPLQRV